MKVREDIFFDKHSGDVVGLDYLGEFNNTLADFKAGFREGKIPVATHVLGLIVRGLVTSLKFPYAHFPTTGKIAITLALVTPCFPRRSLCRSARDNMGGDSTTGNMWLHRYRRDVGWCC